jgi:hypothetical protein
MAVILVKDEVSGLKPCRAVHNSNNCQPIDDTCGVWRLQRQALWKSGLLACLGRCAVSKPFANT